MNITGFPNLKTRPATLHDLPQIEALIEQSMHVLAGRDYSFEQIESALRYLMGIDPRIINDGTYLVAEVDGKVVGAGGWSMRQALYGRGDTARNEDPCLLNPAREPSRLRALFVHPGWARRGIGKMLVHLAEYNARDYGFRAMELVSTLTGRALYEATGYRAIKQVEITLPDGVLFPGISMRKSLVSTLGLRPVSMRRKTTTGLYQQIR